MMNYSPSYYRRSIDALMDEAGRHEVPSAEKEAALIRQAKHGSAKASHELVLGNLRLVIKLAHRMGGAWNADLMEELAAAGVMGLLEAIKAYRADASSKGRFISYAIFHIRRQMRRTLSDFRTPVSANTNNYDLARKILDRDEAAHREGRVISNAEIGKELGLTPNRVERTRKLMESPLYLDHSVGKDDDARSGHELCADAYAVSPALATEQDAEKDLLANLMKAHLDERECAILTARFGLGHGGEVEELQTIGMRYHLSRERVRQIEGAALKKLRFHLAQTCPTYRERAARASGIHTALVVSDLPVRPLVAPESVVVKPVRRAPVPAPRVVAGRSSQRVLTVVAA
jgi:RNA polymerase primary sigma factor